MKKNILFAAFAAMLCVAACQQEIEPVDKSQETPGQDEIVPAEGLVFKAVFEESPVTSQASPASKTVLGENGLDVLWREHDAITLFDGTGEFSTFGDGQSFVQGTRYQVSEGGLSDDLKTASFTVSPDYAPAAEGKDVYWAFCPYISDAAFDFTNEKLIAWLIRYQKGNAGNFSEQRQKDGRYMNFAVGKTTDPENEAIVFKNILCHLKFTIPADMDGKITRIGVHTGAGDYLTGDQCVDVTGDKPVTSLRKNYGTYSSGSTYASSYLLPDHGSAANADITPGETFAAGSYYMAVMPCELKSGLFVTFETEGGTIYHKEHYSTSTTLLRNKVYDMGELTYNNPVSATGTGVSLPYAFSMLHGSKTNADMVYSTQGALTKGETLTGYNNYSYAMASGILASDKTSSVNLSAQTTVQYQTDKGTFNASPYLACWSNKGGHDPILTGIMTNRKGVKGLPFENHFKLTIPLSQDLPSTFNVSVGLMSMSTWGLRDWKLYYSNDNMVWAEGTEVLNLASIQVAQNGQAGLNYVYPFYTFTITPDYKFKNGDILYIKLMPYENKVFNDSANYGVPGSGTSMSNGTTGVFAIHSCIAVYDPSVEASVTPSGSVLYQGFNSVSGGVDYFFGGGDRKRLAGMANLCGGALSLSGYNASNCYSRPGYAQIGYVERNGNQAYNAAIGVLTTPNLGSEGDFTLSFKAAAYKHPAAGRGHTDMDMQSSDNTSIQIEIIGGGTIDGNTTVVIDGVNTEAWQTIEKTITGATASTQIKFTSPSGSTYNRWFIDDILVK